MLNEVLQDKAVQYVAGDMPETDRLAFEVLLEFQDELRATVHTLRDVVAMVATAPASRNVGPAASLKARLLDTVERHPRQKEPEGLVATDPMGLIQWVNRDFTAMCGFSLAELQGRKPGQVLQGAGTDAAAVARIRAAVQAGRACREMLVNYHKDGSAYRADILITPILGDDGRPMWFVAREKKLPE